MLLVGAYQGITVIDEFEQHRWDAPAHVYATPLELYVGLPLSIDELTGELQRLGYQQTSQANAPGEYTREQQQIELITRPFLFDDGMQESKQVVVLFSTNQIRHLRDAAGQSVPLFRMEPLLLGSIFPTQGEDRLIIYPDHVPGLLVETLKTVEDRRFDQHIGIDFIGILRAAGANLRAGKIVQGGSTLTQQLVKSYFLSSRQTLTRKTVEAIMALALELRYEKPEILTAYVNEAYLGQDGSRAIHGFGLASQFYFGKPLHELRLHETALLVGILRGPSYYDPRRHPQRALQRRNLVISLLAQHEIISKNEHDTAIAQPLGVITRSGRGSTYYPEFLDLVGRQLQTDYPKEELATKGLTVFATLDPTIQLQAEATLASGLNRLEQQHSLPKDSLQGAIVVTHPSSAEVLAIVGGRRAGLDGFNRALDARRPAGSLIKPAVYLAGLESGYSLTSVIEDAPVQIPNADGTIWSPKNYDDQTHGRVSIISALAESMNLATVNLGMKIGVDRVAQTLQKLGIENPSPAYPSLLLGSLDISPMQAAQLYTTLANGGFQSKLRAVRSVMTHDGVILDRYPLKVTQASDPGSIYQLNQALVQVIERGTAQTARQWLPASLKVAGKTGTSGDYRDSWFAGFTESHTAVVWVGNDHNEPIGLSGASGALTLWAPLMRDIRNVTSFEPAVPSGLQSVMIEYASGLLAKPGCADTVSVPVPLNAKLKSKPNCGTGIRQFNNRLQKWLKGIL